MAAVRPAGPAPMMMASASDVAPDARRDGSVLTMRLQAGWVLDWRIRTPLQLSLPSDVLRDRFVLRLGPGGAKRRAEGLPPGALWADRCTAGAGLFLRGEIVQVLKGDEHGCYNDSHHERSEPANSAERHANLQWPHDAPVGAQQ